MRINYAQLTKKEKNNGHKNKTLSIIKPDAVKKNHIGEIFSRFEKGGLTIVATTMKTLKSRGS